MRILFFSSGLRPEYGGPPQSESSLIRALLKRNEVKVFAMKGRVDQKFASSAGLPSVRELTIGDLTRGLITENSDLEREISWADVCHLNGHWKPEHYLMRSFCKRRNVPYFLHPRGMMWVGHRSLIKKLVYNFIFGKRIATDADRIIALSRFETRHFAPYGCKGEQVFVLPNGIVNQSSSENKIQLKPPSNTLFYLGRIESRKNLTGLIKDLCQVMQKHNLFFRMMGPIEHRYDKDILKAAAYLGVANQIQFLGPKYGLEKNAYFSESLAVFYPSIEEPFGRVPFEALSVGGFPLVPSSSGAAEYLRLISEEFIYRNRTELEQRIENLIQMPLPKREELVQKGSNWVSHELNWERIASVLEGQYHEAMLRRENALESPIRTAI